MMKKFSWIVVLVSVTLISFGQDQKTEIIIQKTVINLFDGVARLDNELMQAQVTHDFILLEDMKVWTIDSLMNALKPLKKSDYKRVNTLVFKKTEYEGGLAWVYYDNQADITTNGRSRTVHWLESAVLVKEQGAWRIKFMHSTRLK